MRTAALPGAARRAAAGDRRRSREHGGGRGAAADRPRTDGDGRREGARDRDLTNLSPAATPRAASHVHGPGVPALARPSGPRARPRTRARPGAASWARTGVTATGQSPSQDAAAGVAGRGSCLLRPRRPGSRRLPVRVRQIVSPAEPPTATANDRGPGTTMSKD